MEGILTVEAPSAIHVPANSGLRLACPVDPGALKHVAFFSAPFAVVETNGDFVAYAAREPNWDVKLRAEGPRLLVDFGSGGYEVSGSGATLKQSLAEYRTRVQKVPTPAASRILESIQRVITLDLWLPDGKIWHTYADVRSLLSRLAELNLAAGTLLYLPGWNGPYDTGYPGYTPAEELGGEAGFAEIVGTASDLGAVIMPHLNFWAYDPSSGLLPDHEEIQVHDARGNPAGWPGVLRVGYTNPLAFIRIDDPRWQELFFSYFDPLVRHYGLAAVFLDQIGAYEDDPVCDLRSATLELSKRIALNYPELLIGGEVLREELLQYIPLSQAWGPAWCGVETDYSGYFSPICRLAFGDRVRFFGHLGLPAAVPSRYVWTNYPFLVEKGTAGAFEMAQNHRRQLGAIPHVRLNYRQYGIDEESLKVLQGREDGC